MVFAEARRALDELAAQRDDLRTRAATLVTVGSVVTTLLGAPVLGRHFGPATWVAIGAFAVLIVGCVSVLVPLRLWASKNSAKQLLVHYVYANPPRTVDDMRRDLALRSDEHVNDNVRRLHRMTIAIQGSCVLLIVEILALVSALRGKG